jgi:hypothetical protein
MGEVNRDRAIQLVQEAQLFIDAAHACHNKLRSTASAAQSAASPSGMASAGEG